MPLLHSSQGLLAKTTISCKQLSVKMYGSYNSLKKSQDSQLRLQLLNIELRIVEIVYLT